MKTVLIIDDEIAIRETLEQILSYEGYDVKKAGSGAEGLAVVVSASPDVILLDVKMPGMDGFEVLDRLAEGGHGMPVIVISGHGNIETAVEAVRKGAYDFLEKPLDRSRLLVTLTNCLDHQEVLSDRRIIQETLTVDPLVGESRGIKEVRSFIEKVGPSEATVLITGENGTGKELVVRGLHRASSRKDRPLVEVNCAAIPRDLVESELFGHEKGQLSPGRTGRGSASSNWPTEAPCSWTKSVT